jgi:hypothetical protein
MILGPIHQERWYGLDIYNAREDEKNIFIEFTAWDHFGGYMFICYNIQNYNFACGSVWVWNLVSDIKGGT